MKRFSPFRSERGSALLSVVIFTTVSLLLVASLLSWSMTERRLNYRNALRLEARNAAEALSEYGFSQIREKMASRSNVTLNPSGSDALAYPAASFWSGSNVDTTKNELIGGTVQNIPADLSSYYFNPADPNNAFDPLNGKHVFRRDIQVIAKATVKSQGSNRGEITAYVSQRISVRGAPLFAHAIFYNMDLEIFNGPQMVISGPVHTNGNLYLYPDNALTFTDQVTSTGNIYHAKKPGDTSSDGNSASGRNGSVNFPNKFSTAQNMKVDGVWNDSTHGAGTSATLWDEFRDKASQRWNGNLQTSAHGVANYNPVAIGDYSPDPTPGVGSDDSVNSGRNIIEPSNYPAPTDPDYDRKMEIEQQKYSNDAGLYITVNPTTHTITVSSRSKVVQSDGTFKNKPLTLPAGNNLVTYKAFKATSSFSTTNSDTTYSVGAKRTNNPNKNKYPITQTTTTVITPKTITYTSAGSSTTAGTPNSSSSDNVTYSSSPSTPSSTSSTSSTTPTSPVLAADNQGMYDQHRQKGTDLVEIDMDALRKAVASMSGAATASTTTGNVALNSTDKIGGLTAADWTGIVYVEVQGGPSTDPITGATNAATDPASMQTSVRIINGKGKIPSYGTATEGLTIATNAPVYIKGSFNADGTTTTSSPNSATTPETGELPAAIVGDAVTILSQNFNDSTSLSTANPTAANPSATPNTIEIAAALLVGLTPTNKEGDGKTSGGAHNLPRFLENWADKSVFIRGSLVALFENRIFTEPHGGGYYSPPARNWGFNTLLRNGRYPPGTPQVISYRRVDFTDLTAAEYAAARDSFGW